MKTGVDKMRDMYEGDDQVRFLLGETGDKPLICFGVNPSTADAVKDDPTITRIRKIAEENDCDGWIMLNLYPQRATNPKDMGQKVNGEWFSKNIERINEIFQRYHDALTLAAWGDAIETRKYLKDSLKKIVAIDRNRHWVCRGELTAKGNPRHPLYVADHTPLKAVQFDADGNVRVKTQ